MATDELEIKFNEWLEKNEKFKAISASVKQLSELIDKPVTQAELSEGLKPINASIKTNTEAIKAIESANTQALDNEEKANDERAEVKSILKGKKGELWRQIYLWDNLKILVLVIAIVLSVATAYVLNTDDQTIPAALKKDLSIGFSVLAALSALLYLSLFLGQKRKSMNISETVEELENLEMNFTNPTMTSQEARTKYGEIMTKYRS